jgi:hypothetical protein
MVRFFTALCLCSYLPGCSFQRSLMAAPHSMVLSGTVLLAVGTLIGKATKAFIPAPVAGLMMVPAWGSSQWSWNVREGAEITLPPHPAFEFCALVISLLALFGFAVIFIWQIEIRLRTGSREP